MCSHFNYNFFHKCVECALIFSMRLNQVGRVKIISKCTRSISSVEMLLILVKRRRTNTHAKIIVYIYICVCRLTEIQQHIWIISRSSTAFWFLRIHLISHSMLIYLWNALAVYALQLQTRTILPNFHSSHRIWIQSFFINRDTFKRKCGTFSRACV